MKSLSKEWPTIQGYVTYPEYMKYILRLQTLSKMLSQHTQVHFKGEYKSTELHFLRPEDRSDLGGERVSQSDQVSMEGTSMGS